MKPCKNSKMQGALLRMERLQQNKGQKEVCYGICVPSYLSKIEHGTVSPDDEIVKQLFQRLGIEYQMDEEVLAQWKEKINLYFDNKCYALDTKSVYRELEQWETTLRYSDLAIDWFLIKGLEEKVKIPYLEELESCMNRRQKGYYYLLRFLHNPESKEAVEWCTRATEILGNCYSYMKLVHAYYINDAYTAIHQLENRFCAIALEEGNTYYLADYYFMKGSAYACLNMDGMMMECYQKSIRFLQNTGWVEELSGFYYNIGATYISLEKYEDAIAYLKKANPSILSYHKLALAYIRSGDIETGKEFLEKMKKKLLTEEADETEWLRYEEAQMECEKDFIDNPKYLEILEKLIESLEKNYPFGHLYFYRKVVIEAYKRQRKYKKALEFEERVSSKAIKSSV